MPIGIYRTPQGTPIYSQFAIFSWWRTQYREYFRSCVIILIRRRNLPQLRLLGRCTQFATIILRKLHVSAILLNIDRISVTTIHILRDRPVHENDFILGNQVLVIISHVESLLYKLGVGRYWNAPINPLLESSCRMQRGYYSQILLLTGINCSDRINGPHMC